MKYRVKIENNSFEVEISDLNARPIQVIVDGDLVEVWPETAESLPSKSTNQPAPETKPIPCPPAPAVTPQTSDGASSPSGGNKAVKAPIPGVILSVNVKVGDSVSAGQELCILEAMKMKNSIRATRSGTIGKINITAGDQVQHGNLLMEFTD